MRSRSPNSRIISMILLLGHMLWPSFVAATNQVCDANKDGTVDRTDITAITSARNTPATPVNGIPDPRDADHDGMITVKDAKICVLQCSKPNCEAGKMPTSGAEPPYEPERWTFDGVTLDLAIAQARNNCYNYACNRRTDTFAQPGRGSLTDADPNKHYTPPGGWDTADVNGNGTIEPEEHFWKAGDINCQNVKNAAIADGLVEAPCNQACPNGDYKKALVVDPGKDYHWFRQDNDGTWSQKHGGGQATNLDDATPGKPILDPRVADRDGNGLHYTDFCGCFCCGVGVVKR